MSPRGLRRLSVLALWLVVLVALPTGGAPSRVAAEAARPRAVADVATDQEPRPLLLVLDTSSSMDEDDGTGTIKLAGAQAALTRVIRQQRPGARVGLWTFPNDGACGSGTSTIDLGPLDQSTMIPAIRGLTASGDTPTGTALRAAVDSIKGEYDGATVLLISDGLHTCEPDPCEVAQEIRDEGFDLTVYPAGFQTSEEGMAELECIAQATGGEVYEADDAQQLGQVIEQATDSELDLEVSGMPERIPAGAARTVTVTVTNNTAQDIGEVRTSFTFANATGGGPQVVPSVLPPLRGSGNLPAGASASYSWLVGFGSGDTTGAARYRVVSWGSNSQPVAVEGQVSVVDADQTLGDGGGVIGDLAGKRIAILGDSFSSGEGAAPYLAGTAVAGGNGCHKSMNTYMATLFQKRDVELIACSGAVTRYGSYDEDKRANAVQEEQVETLRDRVEEGGAVDAAFMTIGGNDIGFAPIILRCVAGHAVVVSTLAGPEPTWDTRCSDDLAWRRGVRERTTGLDADLQRTYRQVYAVLNSEAAVDERGGVVAPLYVLAYPQVFPEARYRASCPLANKLAFDSKEVDYANELVDDLNSQIARSVAVLQDQRYRVEMVRSVQESFLPNNTLCPRPGHRSHVRPFTDSLSLAEDGRQEGMHPTVQGYRAETNAIITWSNEPERTEPRGGWRVGGSDGPGLLTRMARGLNGLLPVAAPDLRLDLSTGRLGSADPDVRAGQTARLEVSGGAPGSTVDLVVASRPRLAGRVTLDDEGRGSGLVEYPLDLPSGGHEVRASGFDRDGNPVLATSPVDVAGPVPLWVPPVALVALGCLVAAAVLRRRDRRARREGLDVVSP